MIGLLAASLMVVAASAQAAKAASVSYDATSQTVSYIADPGEANSLTVDQSPSELTFTDIGTLGAAAVQITDADGIAGCSVDPMTPSVAVCPTANVNSPSISAGDGDDVVASNATLSAPTVLDGGVGNDQLTGAPGADVLIGDLGDDTLDGGGGSADAASFAGSPGSVTVNLASTAPQATGAAGSDTLTGIENLIGSDQDDTLTGDSGDNVLSGGAGNDTLEGGPGNDLLDGGSGTGDTASYAGAAGGVRVDLSVIGAQDIGAAGSDTIAGIENLTGSDQADILTGDGGNNVLSGGAGDDTLAGGLGADSMSGGPGNDTTDYSARAENLTVTLDGVANDGVPGEGDNVMTDVANVVGGTGDDLLTGNEKENRLSSGPGNDLLDGGEGADSLAGGAGFDSVTYAGRTVAVTIDLAATGRDGEVGENDVLTEVERAVGGAGNDRLSGDDRASVLDGGPGNDVLDGRGGDDLVIGGTGNDLCSGGSGNDQVDGSGGGDVVYGGAGIDQVAGGTGDDILEGGLGADTLSGGGGNDTVDYSSRTRRVQVTLDGKPNDGEAGEADHIRADVHSVKTGAGRDLIDARDGLRGNVTCGTGSDVVRADTSDRVDHDCEEWNGVSSAGRCRSAQRSARMNKKGIVALRVTCVLANRGSIVLEARELVRSAKRGKGRVLRLGRAAFSFKSGRSGTVKVRLSKAGRRAVLRAKPRLNSRAITTTRHRAQTKPTRITRKVVLRK